MQLQSIIIPDEKQCPELYFRGALMLAAGEVLTFDTYFNSFSYTKYQEYTTVQKVCFFCKFSGRAKVELCVFDGTEHIICGGEFSDQAALSVDFSTLPKHGFLYPKITALAQCTFLHGEYNADCRAQEISCCIAICTYKRESYVLKNTALMRAFGFSFIKRVFVIDNGNSLDSSALSDDFIKVLPNKNYGGSGGFTRGLIEAHDGEFSHVILMDDDVEFHCETLEQMTVFISLLKPSYAYNWFSAGMLPADKPCFQFELGAEWNGKHAIVHKHNIDIRKQSELLDNLHNPNVEYGGWWTLLMPVSVVQNGLPYPFFIKFDDVEYGMRKSSNTQIITMNGIAVRHEAFERKKNFVLEYYNLRNELTINTIYGKFGVWGALQRFWYETAKHLFLYRYENIPLVFRAVNDFLSGTDFFLHCDEEDLNNKLIAAAPKLVPLEKIPEWNETLRCDEHCQDKKITPIMLLTLGGHLIPRFMFDCKPYAVPLSHIGAKDCFRKRTVIQYQLGGSSGITTKRSLRLFLKYSIKMLGLTAKLLLCFRKAKKSLQTRKLEITSEAYWRKHLGLK